MWIVNLINLVQLLFAGVIAMPVTNKMPCPQFSTFYGYDLSHLGCCLDESNCMYNVAGDERMSRQIEKEIPWGDWDTQRTRRNVDSNLPYTTSYSSSSLYTLCRSNVSVINPIFATSVTSPQSQVQILQLPPLLTQSIVVHVCEEVETPIVRGYCKQHYKWESVYTVRGNQSNGEVTFQKEWILVGAGCDLAFDFDIRSLLASSYALRSQLPPPSSTGPNYVQSARLQRYIPSTARDDADDDPGFGYAKYEVPEILNSLALGARAYPDATSPSTMPSTPYYESTSSSTTMTTTMAPTTESIASTTTTTMAPTTEETTMSPTTEVTTMTPTTQGFVGRAHDGVVEEVGHHGVYQPKYPGPSQTSVDGGPAAQNVQNLAYSPNLKEPREYNKTGKTTNSRGYPRRLSDEYGPSGPTQIRSVNQKDYFTESGSGGTKNSTSEYPRTVYAKPYRRMYQTPVKIGLPVYSMTDNPDRIRALKYRI